MLTLIEQLREKPKAVRVQAALAVAIVVTGIIALLWGVTLPYRLSGLVYVESETVTMQKPSERSFFGDAQENLAQLIGAVSGGGEGEEETPEVSGSASGSYRPGVPEGAESPDTFRLDRTPAAQPVSAREVRIATTTR